MRIGWANTLPVAGQVNGDDGEISREQRRHLAPHKGSLWKSVEQEKGRPSQRAPMHEDVTRAGGD